MEDLDTSTVPYQIRMHVADSDVDIMILDSTGTQVQPVPLTTGQQVVHSFNTALGSNPLYLVAYEDPLSFFQREGVGVVFKKVLLQYWSDDIGELFGTTNASAAALFDGILIMKYDNVSLMPGTSPWAAANL